MTQPIKTNSENNLKFIELVEGKKKPVKSINHKDGDLTNNDTVNLESVTENKLEYFTE